MLYFSSLGSLIIGNTTTQWTWWPLSFTNGSIASLINTFVMLEKHKTKNTLPLLEMWLIYCKSKKEIDRLLCFAADTRGQATDIMIKSYCSLQLILAVNKNGILFIIRFTNASKFLWKVLPKITNHNQIIAHAEFKTFKNIWKHLKICHR